MKHYFNLLIEAIKYRKIIFYISYVFAALGFQITLFFLTQEFPDNKPTANIPPKLTRMVYGVLTPNEIEKIFIHPETRVYAKGRERYNNCLCYALTNEGEIISYMWCNLLRGPSFLSPFVLKNDEAYLFGAYTYNKYRGLGLAPYLRRQVYQSLVKLNRTKYYSITEYFNTSAKKLKKKLQARHLKLELFIKLFNITKFTITLKKYSFPN